MVQKKKRRPRIARLDLTDQAQSSESKGKAPVEDSNPLQKEAQMQYYRLNEGLTSEEDDIGAEDINDEGSDKPDQGRKGSRQSCYSNQMVKASYEGMKEVRQAMRIPKSHREVTEPVGIVSGHTRGTPSGEIEPSSLYKPAILSPELTKASRPLIGAQQSNSKVLSSPEQPEPESESRYEETKNRESTLSDLVTIDEALKRAGKVESVIAASKQTVSALVRKTRTQRNTAKANGLLASNTMSFREAVQKREGAKHNQKVSLDLLPHEENVLETSRYGGPARVHNLPMHASSFKNGIHPPNSTGKKYASNSGKQGMWDSPVGQKKDTSTGTIPSSEKTLTSQTQASNRKF